MTKEDPVDVWYTAPGHTKQNGVPGQSKFSSTSSVRRFLTALSNELGTNLNVKNPNILSNDTTNNDFNKVGVSGRAKRRSLPSNSDSSRLEKRLCSQIVAVSFLDAPNSFIKQILSRLGKARLEGINTIVTAAINGSEEAFILGYKCCTEKYKFTILCIYTSEDEDDSSDNISEEESIIGRLYKAFENFLKVDSQGKSYVAVEIISDGIYWDRLKPHGFTKASGTEQLKKEIVSTFRYTNLTLNTDTSICNSKTSKSPLYISQKNNGSYYFKYGGVEFMSRTKLADVEKYKGKVLALIDEARSSGILITKVILLQIKDKVSSEMIF